jgi:hypothetical protein
MTRPPFQARCSPAGARLEGSPDEVIAQIQSEQQLCGHERFLA